MQLRQTAGLAVPLVVASVLLAACSSSGSSSSSTSGGTSSSASSSSSAGGLKTGLKVFVIPKNLGNNYFTTADSAKTDGAIAALNALGESGTETSGTAATPASQIPAIQAAISKGANALIVSATDPTALCPTLTSAMKRGITVVTYDSDAPTCRDLFINQASTAQIGTSEVDVLAKQIGSIRPLDGNDVDAAWLAAAGDWFPPSAFRRVAPPIGGIVTGALLLLSVFGRNAASLSGRLSRWLPARPRRTAAADPSQVPPTASTPP